jgi:hypothetical protein
MAGATPNYGWAYFDFGDALDSRINAQKEIDRFMLIDGQIFGLYSIFGNGVVSGWVVEDAGGLAVRVTPGVGIISAMASETTFPADVTELPASDSITLYAVSTGETPTNRAVRFIAATVKPGDEAIPIATIETGPNGVTAIDNSVRQLVGFKEIIEDEIANHRHTGTPSKIQLETETRGQLPGSRMEDFDAAKIGSGKLTLDRLSQINHNSLKNVGNLTHAQLDSLVGAIQRDNEQLLGETASVNLMRAVAFLKYKDADIDEFFVNELAIIPGVSPSDFIDWDNTDANVNTTTQCISGLPAEYINPDISGEGSAGDLQVVTVSWEDDDDFERATVNSNLQVLDGVRIVSDTVEDMVVEDFEVVASGDAGGYAGSVESTSDVSASYDSSTAAQGFNSGKFEVNHTFFAKFKKTYATPADWTGYNQLVVYVKSYSASHAGVHMRIDDKDGEELGTYTLLAADEVTSTGNELTGGFAEKVFEIDALDRDEIGAVTIYTDNISQEEEIFYIDNIFLRNTELLLPQGTLRLRYSAASPVVFRSVEYEAEVPVGTDFRARVRTGMDVSSLVAAPFGTRLASGDVFSVVGREIEIEFTFYSDTARTLTPELSLVQLQMLVEAEDAGFTITSADDWDRGTLSNTVVATSNDDAYVKLQYTNVGDKYFLFGNTVNEIDPDRVPVFGVNGGKLPLSPLQGYKAIQSEPSRGFTDPRSVYRLENGDFLVADTGNDRVVQVTPDGVHVRGFGSHNRDYDTETYALSAVYNPTLGKLFIAYSSEVVLDTFDLRDVHISWGTNILTLDNTSDTRKTLLDEVVAYNPTIVTTGGTAKTDRVLVVELSKNHQLQLDGVTDQLYVQIDSDPDLNYIECFHGDFMYYGRGAILRPVYVNKLDDSRWMIANSHVFHGYDDMAADEDGKKVLDALIASCQSIINVDEDTGRITANLRLGILDFQYNSIDFSDITFGGIYPLAKDRLLIGGIRKKPTAADASDNTGTSGQTTESGTATTDLERLKNYQGYTIVIDKATSRLLFKYESPEGLFPSDVILDDDGYYVIAETSLIPQAGRIVKIDRFGNIAGVIADGMYTKINDIRKLNGNRLLVST